LRQEDIEPAVVAEQREDLFALRFVCREADEDDKGRIGLLRSHRTDHAVLHPAACWRNPVSQALTCLNARSFHVVEFLVDLRDHIQHSDCTALCVET
jgi:hypothetical protein